MMNKIIYALRQGMVQASSEGNASTPEILSGEELLVEVPIDTSKLLMKSIDVIAEKEVDFSVTMIEEPTSTTVVYDSGVVTGRNYDVLDMVYIDRTASNKCYVAIRNQSEFDTKFTVLVRGLYIK